MDINVRIIQFKSYFSLLNALSACCMIIIYLFINFFFLSPNRPIGPIPSSSRNVRVLSFVVCFPLPMRFFSVNRVRIFAWTESALAWSPKNGEVFRIGQIGLFTGFNTFQRFQWFQHFFYRFSGCSTFQHFLALFSGFSGFSIFFLR